MILYKKLVIDNYKQIQEKIYNYFVDTYNGAQQETVGFMTPDDIARVAPELTAFFKQNDMHPAYGAILIRTPHVVAPVHIDNDLEILKPELAINLPIANCDNTLMNWFNFPVAELEHINDRGNRYRSLPLNFDWNTLELLDSVELTDPHLLRIDVPHNVVNNKDLYRMILSIRFDPQPLHLWPEAMEIFH